MIAALYAALSAFLLVGLSLNVIRQRRAHHVSLGDGGQAQLIKAIAAQTNAVEYLPIALILLCTLEYNHANHLWIHAFGITLLIGRIIHAKAIQADNLKARVLGMQITFGVILGLAALNIAYLPYATLLSF